MHEGETDQWMGGQWAERERVGGGSLDDLQTLKDCTFLMKCCGVPKTGEAIPVMCNY